MMNKETSRPVVFDYQSVSQFVADMLDWRRQNDRDFSIRTSLQDIGNCSPTLVSQVAKGTRGLTRDRVHAFGQLLNLTAQETKYLDQWVAMSRSLLLDDGEPLPLKKPAANTKPPRRPQNKLVDHWLNLYVRETCRLKGFSPDPAVIHRLLGGIATIPQIKKSLDFLMREGFIRRTIDNDVVQSQMIAVTTDGVPNLKLNVFHRKALDVIKRGLDLYPMRQRRSDVYVLALNEENLEKIKKILMDSMDQVEQFENDHPNENERLYQVAMYLTPVGGRLNDLH